MGVGLSAGVVVGVEAVAGVGSEALVAAGESVDGVVDGEVGAGADSRVDIGADGIVDVGAVSPSPHAANKKVPIPKSKNHNKADRMRGIIAGSFHGSRWGAAGRGVTF